MSCTLASLGAGVSANFEVNVSPAVAGGLQATAFVSSDTVEWDYANNSFSVLSTVADSGNAGTDGDVPTLPEWGMILMGGMLLGVMHRRGSSRGSTGLAS